MEVVYNPEFIAQGSIIKDLQNADMVLVGGASQETFEIIKEIYCRIQAKPPKFGMMSSSATEIVKLAVNCYLTTKISYANMIGQVMCMSGMEREIDNVLQPLETTLESDINILSSGMDLVVPVSQETIDLLLHLQKV